MYKWFYKVSAVMVFASIIGSPAFAQGARPGQGEWEHLGCLNVGLRPDRDVLDVTRRQGAFSAITLYAVGNDVNVVDLKVVYGNGRPDDIRLRSRLAEGQRTKPIDLEGRERFIDRIELVSKIERRGGGEGAASICISGLKFEKRRFGGGGGGRGGWEELGCAGVSFSKDRDIIPVGRREGIFKSIRLAAFGNDIDIDRLRVIYGNGQPDEIRVRSILREGAETRPLDLKGNGRRIDRVELITRQDPKGLLKGVIKGVVKGDGRIGKARVCVYGLEDGRFGNRR